MKNKNVEVLNALYQNTSMGISALEKVIPKVKDKTLKDELQSQLQSYNETNQEITQSIYSYDASPKDISGYSKFSADMGIKMNTAISKSSSHIAQMMIQGTDMGIIDINKQLNRYQGADDSVIQQAKDLLDDEQVYLDKMKKYL